KSEQSRRAAESGPASPAVHATAAAVDPEAALEESEDPREAVVAQEEIELGVVGAPADVWTERSWDRIHDDHPPAARDERGYCGDRESTDAATQRTVRGDEPHERERGQDQIGLQVLGEEREADQDAREDHPAESSVLETSDDGPCGGYEKKRQDRVGVVEPEHQNGDRGERHHDRR